VRRGAGVLAALAIGALMFAPAAARAGSLTMDQAVAVALQRNRDVIAAKLDIDAAELDVVAARIYPNPVLQYTLGNLVIGPANNQMMGVSSGFFGQPVQALGVSQVLDVWSKRGARARFAEQGVERRRLLTEDAVREIVFAVRSGFADVLRAQADRQLASDMAGRYAETIRLSQARFKAGDISEAELRKIELEGLRYQNDVIDADTQLDLARTKLAALMGLGSPRELPAGPFDAPDARQAFELPRLTDEALQHRPDLRAAGAGRSQAEAELAAARREVYPDVAVGATYVNSDFTVSGDNPNSLALSLSLPLPLFDRNQAGIGRAEVDIRRADNDVERLRIQVVREVAEAVRRADRARVLLAVFEGPPGGQGGMAAQAEKALQVAEKSYKAGAISLLELLEAQRTYLDTRGRYVHAQHDFRQAAVDVSHAVGE